MKHYGKTWHWKYCASQLFGTQQWVRKWCQVLSCSETLPRIFFWGNLIGAFMVSWWSWCFGVLLTMWGTVSQRFRDWLSSIAFLQPLSRPLVTGPKCARGTNIPSSAFARHWWWGATKSAGGVVREASYLVPLRLECDWFIEVPVYTDRLQEEPKLILQVAFRVVLGAFRIQLLALEWAVSSTWEAGNKVPEAHDLPAQGSVKAQSEIIYVFSTFRGETDGSWWFQCNGKAPVL